MFIRVRVDQSKIFGKGLFPLDPVPRGKIVCSFTTDSRIITEQEYVEAIAKETRLIVRTGTRYVGKYFTYTDDPDADLNFFNHSFDPNLLVHCGIVIARRDIPAGQELTVDYRTLIDDTDIGVYNDAITGQRIRGFSARDTLLQTAQELIRIVQGVETWTG